MLFAGLDFQGPVVNDKSGRKIQCPCDVTSHECNHDGRELFKDFSITVEFWKTIDVLLLGVSRDTFVSNSLPLGGCKMAPKPVLINGGHDMAMVSFCGKEPKQEIIFLHSRHDFCCNPCKVIYLLGTLCLC